MRSVEINFVLFIFLSLSFGFVFSFFFLSFSSLPFVVVAAAAVVSAYYGCSLKYIPRTSPTHTHRYINMFFFMVVYRAQDQFYSTFRISLWARYQVDIKA